MDGPSTPEEFATGQTPPDTAAKSPEQPIDKNATPLPDHINPQNISRAEKRRAEREKNRENSNKKAVADEKGRTPSGKVKTVKHRGPIRPPQQPHQKDPFLNLIDTRVHPDMAEISYMNLLPQYKVNEVAEKRLEKIVQLNSAGLPILMRDMSRSWQKVLSIDYLREYGFNSFADKFDLALGEIPPLRDFFDTLPQEIPMYLFASTASMITHRLPEYNHYAYKYGDIQLKTGSGRAAILPYDILNPKQWAEYLPDKAGVPPEQVQGMVESMINACLGPDGVFLDYTKKLVKLQRQNSNFMADGQIDILSEEESAFIQKYGDLAQRIGSNMEELVNSDTPAITKLSRDVNTATFRWIMYMLARTKPENTIPPEELKDIEIHAQNQLIQVFYDLHQVHNYSEEEVKEAFRFFVNDLGIVELGTAMGIKQSDIQRDLRGVYAPIEAYFGLRSLPEYSETNRYRIRAAVSEEDPDEAAWEDRKGIDVVIENGDEIVAVGQVKGSAFVENMMISEVPKGNTGIKILDKDKAPQWVDDDDIQQCFNYIESLPAEEAHTFVSMMKKYFELLSGGRRSKHSDEIFLKAIHSISKVRRAAKIKGRKQSSQIIPLFIVAPNILPESTATPLRS